ncbi:MAG: hypothetical protein R8K54_05935 [Mariprofundaceae bacterium]
MRKTGLLLSCVAKKEAKKATHRHARISSEKVIQRAQNKTRILRFDRLMPFSSAHLQSGV